MKFGFWIVLAAAAGLVSCASAPALEPGPQLTRLPTNELPVPLDVDPATGERVYRVGPLDTLQISVFGLPELSRTIQVDGGGKMEIPLAGPIQAAGKTPTEISREIAGHLRTYVRNPEVTVNVDQTVSRVITIDGEVREPGLYPAVGRMTLMRAIASARGLTEIAREQEVVVFRTVGEQRMAALYNLDAIRRGRYDDPPIFADDVVVVGDSPQRRLFRDVLQVSPLVLAPIVALLQR